MKKLLLILVIIEMIRKKHKINKHKKLKMKIKTGE